MSAEYVHLLRHVSRVFLFSIIKRLNPPVFMVKCLLEVFLALIMQKSKIWRVIGVTGSLL